MSTLPRICKREDEEDGDAKLAYCSQKTAEFIGCSEDSILKYLEADCRTNEQRATNVEDDTLTLPSRTTLNDLTMQNDENFRCSPLINAAVEHLVVECETPEGYLIPCRQIKVEPDDSFYEPEEESQTDGKWPRLSFKEATTVKSEFTDDAALRCGAAPERNVKDHAVADGSEGTAIVNCSVVLHLLDTSLLKTLQSPYDAVALADELKAQTQNCDRCKKCPSGGFYNSTNLKLHGERGDRRKVEEGVKPPVDFDGRAKIPTAERPRRRVFRKKLKITGERGKVPKKSSSGKKRCECSYCGKTFAQISNLKSHAVVHTGERPFQCSYCDEKFHLNHHKKRHERRHRCSYCDEEFHDVAEKTLHERTHTGEMPYQCSHCEKKFRHSWVKTRHERTTHDGDRQRSNGDAELFQISDRERITAEEKPHRCRFCDRKFKRCSHRKDHERIHTGEKPHRCRFCVKKFQRRSHREEHERIHTGEKPYQCSYCDRTFTRVQQMTSHERTHTAEASHRCSYCDEKFRTDGLKTKHERTHTAEMPYQCMYCEKKFRQSFMKTRHERTAHDGDQQRSSSEAKLSQISDRERTAEEKPHRCRFCDKKFIRPSHREEHERIHTGEKPYQCSYCDRAFTRVQQRTTHERTHTAEASHRCSYCDEKFRTHGLKTKHERTAHGELANSRRCSYCDQTFRHSSSKTRHERRTHNNGDKFHRRSDRDDTFSQNSDRESRGGTRPGERPYRCSFCDMTFKQDRHRNDHEKIHGDKAFECAYCEKKFHLNYVKNRHERNVHVGRKPDRR